MFYSHEILTSRKYGVATVWLVATLGSKSTARKVTRKAIMDVDVQKACGTISDPEAPMALRLQSNLLYGVSRVFDSQCTYVLSDAQAAQNTLRTLLRSTRSNNLDVNAGKARPEQIMMMDDPAFDPDMALPALELDIDEITSNTQRSSQSMLSIPGRSGSVSSPRGSRHISINLPSSSLGGVSYRLPSNDILGGSSALKALEEAGQDFIDDEAELYQDELLFEFDANGDLHDFAAEESEARRVALANPQRSLMGKSGTSVRAVDDNDDILVDDVLSAYGNDGRGDDGFSPQDDFEQTQLPLMSGALIGNDELISHHELDDSLVRSEEISFESAEARQKRGRPKKSKQLEPDSELEITNNELRAWQVEYPQKMLTELLSKTSRKAVIQSKKNAAWYVYGVGLNSVGTGVGTNKIPSPLAMFSAESLQAKILGVPVSKSNAVGKNSKRNREEGDEHSEPAKRSRQEYELEQGRGLDDDGYMMMAVDESFGGTEVGRDAPDALQDHPSSALQMPWNISQSLRSHQQGASSSIAGRLTSIINRRPTSASPLVGRGAPLPEGLEQLDMMIDEDTMYGCDDLDDDEIFRRGNLHGHDMTSSQANFEMYGPAAAVDTQTASSSQWVRDTLDRESGNFLDYVRNTISEKYPSESLEVDEQEHDNSHSKSVKFEELFDPQTNTRMVAAQAFYHVLSLVTKTRIWVEQEIDDEIYEPFGAIKIGILA